ncbi:hypothetical protein [Brevibacillus reuszeri]|uniref:hypothetical protein n=1 Tax=Brevibacillus reuszeri TaxID=54915 RepID=UPI0013DF64EF|nr:hypothetical protein [Brevibacillus reuszeri]
MNESPSSLMYIAAWILIIVVALGSASNGITAQSRALEVVNHEVKKDHRLYIDFGSVEEETYTGAEVLQTIKNMKAIDADVQVGSSFFTKDYDVETIDVSMIDLQKSYKVKFIRNAAGSVTTIKFT